MFPSNRVNIAAAIMAAAVVTVTSACAGLIACKTTACPGTPPQTVQSTATSASVKNSDPPRQAIRYTLVRGENESSAAPPESASVQTSSFVSSTKSPYFPLTPAQRDKIERIVMASCGELDSDMSFGNAQVILDRIRSGKFGSSIDEVLDAPHQFEAPWKGEVNDQVKKAVAAVFDRGERVTQTQIYYYVNPHLSYISPTVWSRDKRYILTLGHGKFIHQYWTDK